MPLILHSPKSTASNLSTRELLMWISGSGFLAAVIQHTFRQLRTRNRACGFLKMLPKFESALCYAVSKT